MKTNMTKNLSTLLAILTFAICVRAMADTASEKPNILFIMSDDHTSQAIGAYGGRLATLNPTPTLDNLAREGMRFDRVFCVNSICTPSRASILTGQYPQCNGVLDLDGTLPPERQYLPVEMKKAGYLTAMIGKWHLEAEPATFDYYCVLPGQGKYFNPDFIVRGKQPWPKNKIQREGHSTDVITDLDARLAGEARQDQALLPHAPLQGAARHVRVRAALQQLSGERRDSRTGQSLRSARCRLRLRGDARHERSA